MGRIGDKTTKEEVDFPRWPKLVKEVIDNATEAFSGLKNLFPFKRLQLF